MHSIGEGGHAGSVLQGQIRSVDVSIGINLHGARSAVAVTMAVARQTEEISFMLNSV